MPLREMQIDDGMLEFDVPEQELHGPQVSPLPPDALRTNVDYSSCGIGDTIPRPGLCRATWMHQSYSEPKLQ